MLARATLVAALQSAFPGADTAALLAQQDQYGVAVHGPEADRVRLAMIALCKGDAARLGYFVGVAKTDYPDILAWQQLGPQGPADGPELEQAARRLIEKLGTGKDKAEDAEGDALEGAQRAGPTTSPATDDEALKQFWPDLATVVAHLRHLGEAALADALVDGVRGGATSGEILATVGTLLAPQWALRAHLDAAAVTAWDAVLADVHRAYPGSRLRDWLVRLMQRWG